MALLRVNNVSVGYDSDKPALSGIHFSVEQKEIVAIIGANGAGKTTLAKTISNLLTPNDGDVIIAGKNTRDYTTAQIARDVAYVFQNPDDQLFLTDVYQEVAFAARIQQLSEEQIKSRIRQACDLTDIRPFLHENPHDLPLNWRRFVAIASAITQDPQLFVLDEPTAGQDVFGIARLANLMQKVIEQNKTVLVITHDMDFVADHCQRALVFSNGKLLADAAPNRVFEMTDIVQQAGLITPFRYRARQNACGNSESLYTCM
jgi:energy-coupling factor transport system ATP-binding protein